jgi:hypothetical protein
MDQTHATPNHARAPRAQASKKNVLQRIGEGISRNDHDTPSQLRRKGLAAMVGGAIFLSGGAVYLNDQANRIVGSTIPDSEQNLNPRDYKFEPVPSTGAFGLAEQVDPNHDPRNGLIRFHDQLGHDPQPGDIVAVPTPKPPHK